jgi:hypothetical protein
VESLPRIYAADRDGPERVDATGRWDRTGEAVLDWEGAAAVDAGISHYEVRASHQGSYY